MAIRRKRGTVPGTEGTMTDPTNPPTNPIPGGSNPVAGPLPELVGVEVVEISGRVPLSEAESEINESRVRATRGRKRKQPEPEQPPSRQPAPIDELPQSQPQQTQSAQPSSTEELLSRLKAEISEVMGEFLELRENLRTVRQEVRDAGADLAEVRERSRSVREELQEADRSVRGLQQGLEAATRTFREQWQDTRAELAALRERGEALQREYRDAVDDPPALPPEVSSGAPSTLEPEPTPAPPEPHKLLGVTVDTSATVVAVLPDTPAEKAGLQAGDVVIRVDDNVITSGTGLRDVVENTEAGKEVRVTISRGQQTRDVSVQVAGATAP
jgi:hypothetical protein